MFLRPCCGPVLGKGSRVPFGRIGRRRAASARSCGEPAGRCPTATCALTRAIARATSNRFGEEEDEESEPPQPARASTPSKSRSAAAQSGAMPLRGLLALALDARL